MVRTAAVTLAVGLALAAVAGCGGSSPQPGPYTPSAAGSVSASPSGAPTMPAEAKGTTAESAEAFVRYYLKAFSYATRTGDTTEFDELGTTSCKACRTLHANIASTYANGGFARGKGYSILALSRRPVSDAHRVLLRGSVTQFEQDFKASSAATVEHTEQSELPSVFTVVSVNGQWRMQEWERT